MLPVEAVVQPMACIAETPRMPLPGGDHEDKDGEQEDGTQEEQQDVQPDTDSDTSASLLDGEEYDMQDSDDFIEDDLPDPIKDGDEFDSKQEALLTAMQAMRVPMLSYVLTQIDVVHKRSVTHAARCRRIQ